MNDDETTYHSPGRHPFRNPRCPQPWSRWDLVDSEVTPEAAPPRLPELQWVRDLNANPQPRPPELVEGLLHQGCKMVLSGGVCADWSNCSRTRMSCGRRKR